MTASDSLRFLQRLLSGACLKCQGHRYSEQLLNELETFEGPRVPVLTRRLVLDIERLASMVAGVGWAAGSAGDREAKAVVRDLLRKYKLTPTHPICTLILDYLRACY